MTNFASVADVEARLGRDLNATELLRIDALLTDVSAAIRNYTGQTITEATTTERVRVRYGKAKLSQRPVTAVASVVSVAGFAVMYAWEGFDVVLVSGNVPDSWAWEPYTFGLSAVDVNYTHGYPTVPDDIVGVTCSIVMRAIGREPVDGGLIQESIVSYSYQVGSAGAAGAFGMLPAERDVLDSYRTTTAIIESTVPL